MIFAAVCMGQNLPDAPSRVAPAAPVHYSFWDYKQPQMTYRQGFTSKGYWPFAIALLGTNATDILYSTGCRERNDLGRFESQSEKWKKDGAADTVVLAMAYFLNKSHFRVIPQAMISYGIVLHSRGTAAAISAKCR